MELTWHMQLHGEREEHFLMLRKHTQDPITQYSGTKVLKYRDSSALVYYKALRLDATYSVFPHTFNTVDEAKALAETLLQFNGVV